MYDTSVAPPRPRGSHRGTAFAELIAGARRRRGLTQDEVTLRSGVSRSTLNRWEAGDATRPDPDHIRSVCGVLDIDPVAALVALGYLDAQSEVAA